MVVVGYADDDRVRHKEISGSSMFSSDLVVARKSEFPFANRQARQTSRSINLL